MNNNYYFPAPDSKTGTRDLLAEYGTYNAIDVLSDGTIWPQKLHTSKSSTYLVAKQPALPLFPPNKIPYPWVDMCMKSIRNKQEHHAEIRKQCDTLVINRHKDTRKDSKRILRILDKIETMKKSIEDDGSSSDEEDDEDDEDDDDSNYDVKVIKDETDDEDDSNERLYYDLCLPSSLLQLVKVTKDMEMLDLPKVNSSYAGGCISYHPYDDNYTEGVVMFPTGSSLDSVSVSVLKVSEEGEIAVQQTISHTCDIDNQDRIYGITTTTQDSSILGAIRQRGCTHIVKVYSDRMDDITVDTIVTTPTCSEPASVTFNKYKNDECALAYHKGHVQLWDINENTCTDVLASLAPRFTCEDTWCSCSYASHPKLLVLTDRTGVGVIDLRSNSEQVSDIFVLPNKHLSNEERVMITKSHPMEPVYHLVATDYSLILADNRFPNHPVIQWHHSLLSCPQYIDIVHGVAGASRDDIILLSSQSSAETACFQLNTGSYSELTGPPQSTCPPWHLSKFSDLGFIPNIPKSYTDKVVIQNRLNDVSLVGVSLIRHPANNGFTTIQMTAHGDVFNQTYVNSVEQTDKTCSMGPGSESVVLTDQSLEICHRWVMELHSQDSYVTHLNEESVEHYDASTRFSEINFRRYPHVLCSVCMPRQDHEVDEHTNDVCQTCDLNVAFSQQLHSNTIQDKISCTSQTNETRDFSNLFHHNTEEFKDPLSRILVKMWKDDDNIDDELKERDELIKKKKEDKLKKKKEELPLVKLNRQRRSSDTSMRSVTSSLSDHPGFICSPSRHRKRRRLSEQSNASSISTSHSIRPVTNAMKNMMFLPLLTPKIGSPCKIGISSQMVIGSTPDSDSTALSHDIPESPIRPMSLASVIGSPFNTTNMVLKSNNRAFGSPKMTDKVDNSQTDMFPLAEETITRLDTTGDYFNQSFDLFSPITPTQTTASPSPIKSSATKRRNKKYTMGF